MVLTPVAAGTESCIIILGRGGAWRAYGLVARVGGVVVGHSFESQMRRRFVHAGCAADVGLCPCRVLIA